MSMPGVTKMNLIKIIALGNCLIFASAIIFLVGRFERIIAFYESLEPRSPHIRMVFTSGLEYGGGLITMLFLFVIALQLVFPKQKQKHNLP
jgi:hypothetical protein